MPAGASPSTVGPRRTVPADPSRREGEAVAGEAKLHLVTAALLSGTGGAG